MANNPKFKRCELSQTKRAAIWALYKAGKTYSEIKRLENVPKSTIGDTILRCKEIEASGRPVTFESRPRPGAPVKLTARAARRLVRAAVKERREPLEALRTPSKSGVHLSRKTVRVTLKLHGKARRKARRKPWVSPKNKKKRRTFYVTYKDACWMLWCWSDEATFEVGYDSRTVYVTRGRGEEYLDECLKPSFKSGRIKVGAWGSFMGPERGPLVTFDSDFRMNRDTYLDEVLIPHFVPFVQLMRAKYGEGVVMQEDGAGYHHSKSATLLKRAWGITCAKWPPQSPDLSPIENIWRILKLRLSRRKHRLRTAAEMRYAIEAEWREIPSEVFYKLSMTMPKRLRLLRKNHYGPIKY